VQYCAAEGASVSASKFTPEARGAVLERTAAGLSLRDACRAIGLREATVKGWLTPWPA
jgi:DNA-directed RNA polymerase specialized sigma24 family protein